MTVRPRCTLYHLAASCMLVAGSLLAPASTGASSLSEQVIALVNAQRHAIMGDGCPALAPNPVLEDAANRHAADMANRNYFAHNSLVGTIRDASYLGVSTSYLVEARGGSRLTVYEQNVERATRAELWEPGEEVRLTWSPDHSFAVRAVETAAEEAAA